MKQKFMYAILSKTIFTDYGHKFVREHEQDFNTQQVYKKLTEHYLNSTKESMKHAESLSYLTSVKIGEGKWNGPSEDFIINWNNKLCLYEKQTNITDHFSEGQKIKMLMNSGNNNKELRQVKINSEISSLYEFDLSTVYFTAALCPNINLLIG